MKKKEVINENFLFLILITSFFLKIILSIFFGDYNLTDEWKTIVENYFKFNFLSYYEINHSPIPTVYMPPFYGVVLILIHKLTNDFILTTWIVIYLQCLISTLSSYIFYLILKKEFKKNLSIMMTILFTFYPLNFYSPTQISSITIQILLFCYFIYFFINFDEKKNYIFFGIFTSCMLLIRGEFILIFLISFFILILKKKFKKYFYFFFINIINDVPIFKKKL